MKHALNTKSVMEIRRKKNERNHDNSYNRICIRFNRLLYNGENGSETGNHDGTAVTEKSKNFFYLLRRSPLSPNMRYTEMTKTEEKKLKSKIAYMLGTRPNFITIRDAVWETPNLYTVQASYKGFWYLIQIQDDKIIRISREVS